MQASALTRLEAKNSPDQSVKERELTRTAKKNEKNFSRVPKENFSVGACRCFFETPCILDDLAKKMFKRRFYFLAYFCRVIRLRLFFVGNQRTPGFILGYTF
jgi:hypothetical protein